MVATATGERDRGPPTPAATPLVRIKPMSLPIFSGCKREYHRWRMDWENLQRQGEPSGSAEVKKMPLLDSADNTITKDLRLATYHTAKESVQGPGEQVWE